MLRLSQSGSGLFKDGTTGQSIIEPETFEDSTEVKWKGRKWGQHLAGPRGTVVRLGKQAGLDWNGANRKGWNGASLTSRSRGAEIFFAGWLCGWAGCGME